eukprot:scaffold442_cov268-Pinguiococcus_pyrenoidosus.AAC.22
MTPRLEDPRYHGPDGVVDVVSARGYDGGELARDPLPRRRVLPITRSDKQHKERVDQRDEGHARPDLIFVLPSFSSHGDDGLEGHVQCIKQHVSKRNPRLPLQSIQGLSGAGVQHVNRGKEELRVSGRNKSGLLRMENLESVLRV